MINFKEMIERESVENILLYLAPLRSFPDIDNMFVRYKFEIIEKGLLYPAYANLLKGGMFIEDEKGHTRKGPNWKEPEFVTKKKYGIE
ncbi:hypothetical protein SOASR032_10140 [Pragia fontium]|uniref:Immunity protein n=1 Tax=Pragia fontium TaxID=82985 RepID=A0ABQ5LFR2_9GAMM|nr:immunity protein [Pragia fontium]GKX62445.1 hypothetical protein SOASR032_10140 [Pragia fontium]